MAYRSTTRMGRIAQKTIKVGDYVTYQPKQTREGFLPMAYGNLKVHGIGTPDKGAQLPEARGPHLQVEWEPYRMRFIVPTDCCTKE